MNVYLNAQLDFLIVLAQSMVGWAFVTGLVFGAVTTASIFRGIKLHEVIKALEMNK